MSDCGLADTLASASYQESKISTRFHSPISSQDLFILSFHPSFSF